MGAQARRRGRRQYACMASPRNKACAPISPPQNENCQRPQQQQHRQGSPPNSGLDFKTPHKAASAAPEPPPPMARWARRRDAGGADNTPVWQAPATKPARPYRHPKTKTANAPNNNSTAREAHPTADWTSKHPTRQRAQRLNHHHQWRDGRVGATSGAQTIRLYGKPPQQSLRAHIATPKRRLPKPQTKSAKHRATTTKRKATRRWPKKTYTGSVCPGARFRSCVRLSALRER